MEFGRRWTMLHLARTIHKPRREVTEMPVVARKTTEIGEKGTLRLLKKSIMAGCSKMRGCKAREGSRNEAYVIVRRSDGSRAQHSRRVFFNSLRVGEGG